MSIKTYVVIIRSIYTYIHNHSVLWIHDTSFNGSIDTEPEWTIERSWWIIICIRDGLVEK